MQTTFQIHDLRNLSMKDAYDCTQIIDDIRDGDILICVDGAALMVEAWPVMANGLSAVFHNVSPGFHAETSDKYAPQFRAIANDLQQLVQQAKPVNYVCCDDRYL